MQPQNRLNPSEAFPAGGHEGTPENILRDRMRELAAQNQNLQALVVELLDKNERLRSALAQHEKDIPA
jgi:hypothetical protein